MEGSVDPLTTVPKADLEENENKAEVGVPVYEGG
jgi:hypothetical protein